MLETPTQAVITPESATHCMIRAACMSDAQALQYLTTDADAATYGNFPAYSSVEMWEERLKMSVEPRSGEVILVSEVQDQVIGHILIHVDLTDYSRRHVALLSMCVDKSWRRCGVGSALMNAALTHADNWMGVLRCEVVVWTDNQAAQGLYVQYGFKQEGVLSGYGFRQGRYSDAMMMARLHPSLAHLR